MGKCCRCGYTYSYIEENERDKMCRDCEDVVEERESLAAAIIISSLL